MLPSWSYTGRNAAGCDAKEHKESLYKDASVASSIFEYYLHSRWRCDSRTIALNHVGGKFHHKGDVSVEQLVTKVSI